MIRENEELTTTLEQAAYWSAVFQDGEATAGDRDGFIEWVSRTPAHVAASLQVARIRAAVSGSDVSWPATSIADLVREARAAEIGSVVVLHPGRSISSQPRERRRWPIAIGLAATMVLSVGLAWFAQTRSEQFRTKIGEQRSIVLADGSRVSLNTASKIEVRLRDDRREIDLLEGEALFDVTHDSARPFIVHVGDVAIRALGTQFDIDRRASRTAVTVVDGRVAVNTDVATEEGVVLSEADRVVIDKLQLGKVQHGVALKEVTAWTTHQLVFQNRPLGEVAEEFNRYNLSKIEIRSPALRAQAVTGTFRFDDVASFVTLLADMPGVHVAASPDRNYVLTLDLRTPARK